MDNLHFDVTAEGRELFAAAMTIATRTHKKAVAYAIHPTYGLVLFWHDADQTLADVPRPPDPPEAGQSLEEWSKACTAARSLAVRVPVQKLPYTLQQQAMADFAWHWLGTADYGPEPDTDGMTKPGWRIYCERWGRVGSSAYSFLAVQPVWATYSK